MIFDFITILYLILSFLIGSVPCGLVLTHLFSDINLRQIGSGNIGATNVLRTGRKGLAVATLLADALKGGLAVLIIGVIANADLAQPLYPTQGSQPAQQLAAAPTVENQWTDENGHTWRRMSDGSTLWWNGNDWQNV